MTLEEQSLWSENESPSIKSYTLHNFRQIPQISDLPEDKKFEMEVVGNVLPFKANNYVVEQLIDWNNIPNDPIYVLTFPQKGLGGTHENSLWKRSSSSSGNPCMSFQIS